VKLSPRITIPLAGAFLIACGLVGALWWRLSMSVSTSPSSVSNTHTVVGIPTGDPTFEDEIDDRDAGLLHLRRGDLLALQGKWSQAESEYKKAIDSGGGLAALRKLGDAQLQRRDVNGLQSTMRRMKGEGAKSEDLLLLDAQILLRTGELVRAKSLLENAADSPQKHYASALLALIEDRHTDAAQALKAVMAGWDPVLRTYAQTLQSAYDEFAIFPESQEVHLLTLLSRALAQVQECELALPILTHVTKQQDDYRDAWIVLGFCQLVSERTQESLTSLERAYALDPEKPEIQYFLGRAYIDLKDHRNALTFLQYALQNGFEPQSEVRRIIAEEATEIGDMKIAVDQYRVLAALPDAKPETGEKLVTLLIGMNQKQDAKTAAKEATLRWPTDAGVWNLLGWAHLELDEKAEAKVALEKALSLNPNLESAKERLRKL